MEAHRSWFIRDSRSVEEKRALKKAKMISSAGKSWSLVLSNIWKREDASIMVGQNPQKSLTFI